jgi:thiol-disulfide isomerase/thioredoxin
MELITRRTMLAASATLAVATALRKPQAQTIHVLQPEELVPLAGIDKLVPTDPPVPFPVGSFTDANGKQVTMADFAGKGVVLNLWATWCAPCVAEMPSLDALADRLGAENIAIIPLSSDRGGAKVVQSFYTAHQVRHLGIWLDPHAVATQGWGARGLPTTILIDREGRERGRLEGGADWASDGAFDRIKKLLG